MEQKFGFTKISSAEFTNWLSTIKITRMIKGVQQHHTFSPNYSSSADHFHVQKGMKDFHVNQRGFSDIAQHFSIFKDGTIVTGRDLNMIPAGIKGNNTGYIWIENVGNFNLGGDSMTEEQKAAIILVTSELFKKLKLPLHTQSLVYHHWFDLDTGKRTNGAGNTKTCPGTAFFGGNKVADCEENFLPLVSRKSGIPISAGLRDIDGEAQTEEPTFESPEDFQDVDESFPSL
jgi:hypothetical protein